MNWPDIVLPSIALFIALATTLTSIWVASKTIDRTQQGEHRKWLKEKQREAFVEFLSTSRNAYGSIANRGGVKSTEPAGEEIVKAEIDGHMNQVKHALAVLEIVGPPKMATLGRHIDARLRLDRLHTSPTRESQLIERKDYVLRLAGQTERPAFIESIKKANHQNPLDWQGYDTALSAHRLDSFWTEFTSEANDVLAGQISGTRRWRLVRRSPTTPYGNIT